MRPIVALLLLTSFLVPAARAASSDTGVRWQRDEATAFATARAERKPVLLYLEAVWCHWCHVMDAKTYRDPQVIELLQQHYVPLRIDQDGRPDLAARYRDVGWPATVIFAADGSEILKRQGYIATLPMQRLLRAVLDDPSPEAASRLGRDASDPPGVASSADGPLGDALRAKLQQRHERSLDRQLGGLRTPQRYLDRDSVEYALWRAEQGDQSEAAWADLTLRAARALFDPIWGGVYQYSTGGDWQHPHFEKLTALQAEYLRVYALAYAQSGEPDHAAAVASIRGYLDTFMRAPEGGYHVSQDADLVPGEHSADYFALDDGARRARGVPRVDCHRYTRETAMVAEALAFWFEASGDAEALAESRAAMQWLHDARQVGPGRFRHDGEGATTVFLGDHLAVLRASLQLYRSTAERSWLQQATDVASTIESALRASSGYLAAPRGDSPIASVVPLDEAMSLARSLARLYRLTGDPAHRAMASHALAHLARPEIALARMSDPGILLAEAAWRIDPLHLTIVGAKTDPAARALFDAALRTPATEKRLEWWDRAEGPLPNPDVRYPMQARAAAFVCTAGRCSMPIHAPSEIAGFLAETRDSPPQ